MSKYRYTPPFPKMHKIIPEGKKGIATITHKTPSSTAVMLSRIHGQDLTQRPLTILYVNNRLMMSDGEDEHRTNMEIKYKAKGNVLIAGLGIGMVLTEILKKKEVKKVTVIEISQDVIDLVSPYIKHKKLEIICADIFNWLPINKKQYDTIYFDIWPDLCTDDLTAMKTLHSRFRTYKAKDGWMSSWNIDALKRRKRQGL